MDRHKLNIIRYIACWTGERTSGGSRPSDMEGGGGGHSDPEINGPHFGLRMRGGGGGPPGPLPRIRHCALNEAI